MAENPSRQHQAKTLRVFRKIHRVTGAWLFSLFFVVAVTGLLLGWKKHAGDYLLAKTRTGTTSDLTEWLSLDSLHTIARQVLKDSISPNLSATLDRIDVRNEKGIVKFVFADHYWGIQLDGATGRVLTIERRRSDFIENLHDGSLFDKYARTGNGQIKLIYTSILGLALLTFTITGFWLWYGPKRMRKGKRETGPRKSVGLWKFWL